MNEVLYLTVPTQTGLKRLYRFESNPDGTVIVTSASKPRLAIANSILDLVKMPEEEFPDSIPNSHLSVHSSRYSTTLNQINFPEDNFPQFTQSIKIENRFTPVLVRVFGDLTQPKHDFTKTKYRTLEIPKIQTDKDTLVLGLVLGPKDKEFRCEEDHPSSLMKLEFPDFNIWLIWSLFNKPALKHSVDFKLKGGSLEEPIGGFEEFEIYNFYTLSKSIYTEAFFDAFPGENHF
jgi:hypothetical protein